MPLNEFLGRQWGDLRIIEKLKLFWSRKSGIGFGFVYSICLLDCLHHLFLIKIEVKPDTKYFRSGLNMDTIHIMEIFRLGVIRSFVLEVYHFDRTFRIDLF